MDKAEQRKIIADIMDRMEKIILAEIKESGHDICFLLSMNIIHGVGQSASNFSDPAAIVDYAEYCVRQHKLAFTRN